MCSGASAVTIVVSDALHTPLGRRVAELVAGIAEVDGVVGADRLGSVPGGVPLALVIAAPAGGPDLDGATLGGVDLTATEALLASLADRVVTRVVVVSSAMVYGAWPDNPVPLNEESSVRPNPECGAAADQLELEAMVTRWARGGPACPVAVLRRTLTVSTDAAAVGWLERSLWHRPTSRHGDTDPPAQFLLLEDLARSVVHALERSLDGVFNVAPDGWISAERQRELTGRSTGVRLPAVIADRVAELRWRFQLTSTPPGILPYTMHSWVVSNDRLRSTGWSPVATNEEAFVSVHRPGWWSTLTGRRRQEVALGAMVAGVVAVAAGVVAVLRRRR